MFALRTVRACSRAFPASGAKRMASHAAGPSVYEPAWPYIRSMLFVGGIVGIFFYDRHISDGAITKMISPKKLTAEQTAEALAAADARAAEKREMLHKRSVLLSAQEETRIPDLGRVSRPVPTVPFRAENTSPYVPEEPRSRAEGLAPRN